MSLEIIISNRAKKSADQVYDFIEENFGKKAAAAFKNKTAKTLMQLSKFPYMFRATELGEDVRMGLITKQTSILYEIREDKILVHLFWDNRQEPLF